MRNDEGPDSGQKSIGKLTVIPTPLGNLGDVTLRAKDVLAQVDLLACEDTRQTGKLLSLLGIQKPPMIVINEHTEYEKIAFIHSKILDGEHIGLVSDAGMPAISDPGNLLIRSLIEQGISCEVLPGANAAIIGLVASGMETKRFFFEGFLPRKGRERDARLQTVSKYEETIVLYESPHRMEKTIRDLRLQCGDERKIAIGRELTKMHEQWWRGNLREASVMLEENAPRGEYVLVLEGRQIITTDISDEQILELLKNYQANGASKKDSVQRIAQEFGIAKRRVYELSLH